MGRLVRLFLLFVFLPDSLAFFLFPHLVLLDSPWTFFLCCCRRRLHLCCGCPVILFCFNNKKRIGWKYHKKKSFLKIDEIIKKKG